MQNIQYKCVILVIAHHDPVYKTFKNMWTKHWNAHSNILGDYKCFYLYNEPNQPMRKDGDDLYFPFEETYPSPGLLQKTFGAIEYMKDQNITYNMIFRTNLSSLINWQAFTKYVEKHINTPMFYSGRAYRDRHISGAGMFLSKDLVDILLKNKDKIDFAMPDDHAINIWIHANLPSLEFHYISSERPTTRRELQEAIDRGVIHFRFHRGFGLDYNRNNDFHDMNNIITWLKQKVAEHFSSNHEVYEPATNYLLIAALFAFILLVTVEYF